MSWKIYRDLFFGCGIPYGLLMGIGGGLQNGFVEGAKAGLFKGAVFGLLMSLILGTAQRKLFKKLGSKYGVDISPSQNLTLSYDLDRAYQLGVEAFHLIGAKIKSKNISSHEIVATTGVSWKTWGEILSMRFNKDDAGKVEVAISIKPKFRTTLIDYGRSRENMKNLVKFMQSQESAL